MQGLVVRLIHLAHAAAANHPDDSKAPRNDIAWDQLLGTFPRIRRHFLPFNVRAVYHGFLVIY